ncbi:MAG: hypothetical protein VX498_06600 [Myxococcota bacterium]|nr:hypothetical protein [Myxococcota bacterium]
MAEAKIRLSQKDKTVTIDKLSSDDPLVFEVFDDAAAADRPDLLASILHIGALALLDDRIDHLISSTERTVFPRLERLKRLFQKRQVEFETTTQKGETAEVNIVDVLNNYIEANGWKDLAQQSGTTKGVIAGNKTGDVLCTLEFGEDDSEGAARLAIEVKFDKAVALGNPLIQDVFKASDQLTGEIKKSGFDTAWSQLLETRANRDCPFSIIVFDRQVAHSTVLSAVKDVAFLPGVPGFLVVVDSQSGNYDNLTIAYRIARDLALYHQRDETELDAKILELIVARIIHYLGSAKKIAALVEKQTAAAIKTNREVQKEMGKLVHLAEFSQDYLRKFLQDKTLSAKDLTEFYYAADAKVAWRADNESLEADIKAWQS